jgi:hypothetical protein
MKRLDWILIFIAAAVALGLTIAVAYAHDMAAWNDKKRGDWFNSLKQPNGQSCCNLQDCEPTDAEQRGGQWWAVVRGRWKAVPPEKVLTHPLSIDGEAYICASANGDPKFATIYCFIKPIPGY